MARHLTPVPGTQATGPPAANAAEPRPPVAAVDRPTTGEGRSTGGKASAAPRSWVHSAWTPPFPIAHRRSKATDLLSHRSTVKCRGSSGRSRPSIPRELLADERGAVTAEYAIVIMAAVAFAGLLVAIMRSGEIRSMLVSLVEQALGSAG